jgi:para-nitrobenzyl esterase
MEIAFFFGSDTSMWEYSFSPDDDTPGRQALSEAMMKYVGKFARSGNPNGSGLPVWKKWSNKAGKAKVIIFDADYDAPILEMSNEKVTFDDVYSGLTDAVSELPDEVKSLP